MIDTKFASAKRGLVEALLPLCPFVSVVRRYPNVELSGAFDGAVTKDGLIVLRVGSDPDVLGIPDLSITDHGWSGTLSIGGTRHFTYIPWDAVHSVHTEKGEVIAAFRVVVPSATARPGLKLVKDA